MVEAVPIGAASFFGAMCKWAQCHDMADALPNT
jgi:hypothetical protein